MPKQTISLCMITKNEEKYLEQCLNSVKRIVDEIIVVDTGSTDRTKEIFKKFDAKIFDFKWIDDFSAARNESIKHATKEWILVVDADETLDEIETKKILQLVENNETDAYMFLQKNYTDDFSIAGFINEKHEKNGKSYSGWYGSFIVRLFRNNQGYKFDGTVHELVEHTIQDKDGKIEATNIALNHYGNSDPDIVKKKREMYLDLCKRKVSERKDAASYYECGVLYKENNLFEDAKKSFEKAVELNPRYSAPLFELGIIAEKQNDYDDAIKNYTNSLKITENSDAFQNLGVCYLKKGMLEKAYENLTKAMLFNPNKYTIYNNLGAVLEKSGNYETAAQMLEIGTKLNPKNTIGFYNLGIALDKKGDFENAIKAYGKAIELGHKNKPEIKKRITQLKIIIDNTPKYNYGFKVGG